MMGRGSWLEVIMGSYAKGSFLAIHTREASSTFHQKPPPGTMPDGGHSSRYFYSASRLTEDTASAVRSRSVCCSSSKVICSSSACRSKPSVRAQVRTVPYPAIS